MPDPRAGDVQGFVSGEQRAEIEVGVLVVGEDVFVEQADIVEQGFSINCRGGAGPEDFGGRVELFSVLFVVSPVEHHAPGGVQVARGIDRAGIFMEDDSARAGIDARIFVERRDERGEPFRVRRGIVVEKRDEFGSRGADSSVDRAAEAFVMRDLDQFNPRVIFPDECRGTVRRAVVDDDNGGTARGLRRDRVETFAEESSAVPVWNDDCSAVCFGQCGYPRVLLSKHI